MSATPDTSSYQQAEPRRLLYTDSRFTGAMADDLYMRDSMAGVLTANDIHIEQSACGVVIAERVKAENAAALFIIAGEVEGDVRPLFSPAAAMVVAGAILLGWALWGRVRR